MKRFFQYASLFLFAAYWGMTVLFTLPDNFVKLKADGGRQLFSDLFFQQWEFFAPPPTYNDFLYYTFLDPDTGEVKEVEVMNKLLQAKSKAAPFNANENALEYILSNSLVGVNDLMRAEQKAIKYEEKESGKAISKAENEKRTQVRVRGSDHHAVLHKYAEIVAEKQKVPARFQKLVFTITQQELPKFYQRADPTIKPEEMILFASDTLWVTEPLRPLANEIK